MIKYGKLIIPFIEKQLASVIQSAMTDVDPNAIKFDDSDMQDPDLLSQLDGLLSDDGNLQIITINSNWFPYCMTPNFNIEK